MNNLTKAHPMAKLRYRRGDATQPGLYTTCIIAHVVNNAGKWGKGFTGVLSRRWPQVETHYRNMSDYQLGTIDTMHVEDIDPINSIYVVNMIAQHDIRRSRTGVAPIRYQALNQCLQKLGEWAKNLDFHLQTQYQDFDSSYVTICGPRFGAGLAGGDWSVIEPMIRRNLVDEGINVVIFDPR